MSRGKSSTNFVAAVGIAVFAQFAVGEEPDYLVDARHKSLFLCQWRMQHGLGSIPKKLDVCEHPDMPAGTMLVQFDEWWGSVFEHNKIEVAESLRDTFKLDWLTSKDHLASLSEGDRSGKYQRAAQQGAIEQATEEKMAADERLRLAEQFKLAEAADRQKRQAAARAREIAREAEYSATVGEKTSFELCKKYHANANRAAGEELERRKVLSFEEWSLVHRSAVQVGMSELALICSRGYTEVNRTVTAHGEHKQYVYGNIYVYVDNGMVTSFQDTQ